MTHAVVDEREFDVIRKHVDRTFYLSRQLPDMVFRHLVGPTFFCEYEVVLGGGFWPALVSLARLHDDESINLFTVDPDPVRYYFREYGDYACFSLRISASREDYWGAVAESPSGDPTGAIAFTADMIAITGWSGDWGCWGTVASG